LGVIGRVVTMHPAMFGSARCAKCGKGTRPYASAVLENDFRYPLPWLKRIPPLSELDDVKNTEELTA
jgi:hypothetical protein